MDRIKIEAKSQEDRFHRFSLIEWWNQEKLKKAKILVIGAGALGNEIIKNLALLGIGNLFIVDMDSIENSNLSRSVLYRAKDNGYGKAQTASLTAKEIYPEMAVHFFHGNAIYDLGLGVFRWADVVLGGLDNREARLSINRNCYHINRPWIDGAIESLQGCARVFVPDGPCYECTMSEMDWKILKKRRSCNLLTKAEMEGGKTPTTPTISSIIAGVQCQEALKIIHGIESFAGKGWYFQGLSADSYLVEYQRKEECYSHEPLEQIFSLPWKSAETKVSQILQIAQKELGKGTTLELARDVLQKLVCPKCHKEEEMFVSLGKIKLDKGYCPECPGTRREVQTFYSIHGNESFMDKTLQEIGVPLYDIIMARNQERLVGYELSGDGPLVLGNLYEEKLVCLT